MPAHIHNLNMFSTNTNFQSSTNSLAVALLLLQVQGEPGVPHGGRVRVPAAQEDHPRAHGEAPGYGAALINPTAL
jgi:hypothetical protein